MNGSPPPPPPQTYGSVAAGEFDHDRFVVRQWIRPFVNRYEVVSSTESPVCFVHQKRIKIKEKIQFFADRERSRPAFDLVGRKVFEIRGTYDIVDNQGIVVGALQKQFGASLFRSTWKMIDGHRNEVAMMQESSIALALWRRFCGLIPFAGEILGWIPIPYHFDIYALPAGPTQSTTGRAIGRYSRRIGIRDIYDLDLSGDSGRTIDRRLFIAAAVALDALQQR